MIELVGSKAVARMPERIMGLALLCIFSYTSAFKSPTRTVRDITFAKLLSTELKVDIEPYSKHMFHAKSDISNISNSILFEIDNRD